MSNQHLNEVCVSINWCKPPQIMDNSSTMKTDRKSSQQTLSKVDNTQNNTSFKPDQSSEQDRCYLLDFDSPFNRVIINLIKFSLI